MGILMLNGNNYTGGIQQVYGSSSGNIATFDDGGDNKPLKSLKVAINPVQASGTPTPESPIPIYGWTECKVQRAGGNNLFDNTTWDKGRLDNGVIGYANNTTAINITETGVEFTTNSAYRGVVGGLTPVVGGKQYYFNFETPAPENLSAFVDYYDSNSQWISRPPFSNLFIPPLNCAYIRISFQGKTAGTFITSNIAIYSATTYTINLGGTRYGGTLDVVSGVMTVDRVGVDLGSLTWSGSVEKKHFYTSLNSLPYDKSRGNEIICSCYKNDGGVTSSPYYGGNGTFRWWASTTLAWEIYIDDETGYASYDAFKTAISGQILCYPLATPLTIQLTPTQVKSLLGNNNIWSDTGDILECVYQRDLNIVINEFDARITALEQAQSGTRSLSLSKSAVKEEETKEEITEEPKEEEQNEDKR